jgi:hypothetical protein
MECGENPISIPISTFEFEKELIKSLIVIIVIGIISSNF